MDRQSLWWDFYHVQETINSWESNLLWWKDWLANAWWPLPYLSTPFANAASWCAYAKYKIWLGYDGIIWVLDQIPALPSLEGIRDWLRGQWYEVDRIIRDPWSWVGEHIPRAYGTSPYIHVSPRYWLSDWLFREMRPLYDLYRDPYQTVIQWFWTYNPFMAHLFTDWRGWLNDRIPKAYPISPGIIENFPGWLDYWLHREFFDLWYAKTDFRQWLRTQLIKYLPDVYDLLFATDEELEDILSTRWGWAFDAFRDPQNYIRESLFRYYPDTAAILAAPGSYVWCKLKEYLDLYLEEQSSWLLRIVERFIVAIW